jgi:effector-binding domain-containing protein
LHNSNLVPVFREMTPMLIASITYVGDGEESHHYFDRLEKKAGSRICGYPFCVFWEGTTPNDRKIEVCYPVSCVMETPEISYRILPGALMVSTTHSGCLENLWQSWAAMFDFIERHTIRTDNWRREVYMNGITGNRGDKEPSRMIIPGCRGNKEHSRMIIPGCRGNKEHSTTIIPTCRGKRHIEIQVPVLDRCMSR